MEKAALYPAVRLLTYSIISISRKRPLQWMEWNCFLSSLHSLHWRVHRQHRGVISSFAPLLPWQVRCGRSPICFLEHCSLWRSVLCVSSQEAQQKSFLYEHWVQLCHREAYPLWLSACSIVKVENWVWCVVWESKQLWWKCRLYSLFCVPSPLTLANSANCQQSENSWRGALTHGLLPFRKTLAAIDTEWKSIICDFWRTNY